LREVLLDGLLVRQGILDAKKIETMLAADVSTSAVDISEVFVQLYIEGWVRQLFGVKARAVA
jgi:hypothetical protein